MKRLIQILILLALGGIVVYFMRPATPTPVEEPNTVNPTPTPNPTQSQPEVIIDTPLRGDVVTSPLTVKGRARGTWFFEANIPVTLKDQTGKVLVQKGFMTSDNWMTTDYVEFEGTLIFSTPTTEFGNLIISKDNPSGLPENDAEFVIPLRFR